MGLLNYTVRLGAFSSTIMMSSIMKVFLFLGEIESGQYYESVLIGCGKLVYLELWSDSFRIRKGPFFSHLRMLHFFYLLSFSDQVPFTIIVFD